MQARTKWALVQTCSRWVTPRGKSGRDISLYLLCTYSIANPYWPGGLIFETAFEENSIQHMDLSDIAVIQNSRNNLQRWNAFNIFEFSHLENLAKESQ